MLRTLQQRQIEGDIAHGNAHLSTLDLACGFAKPEGSIPYVNPWWQSYSMRHGQSDNVVYHMLPPYTGVRTHGLSSHNETATDEARSQDTGGRSLDDVGRGKGSAVTLKFNPLASNLNRTARSTSICTLHSPRMPYTPLSTGVQMANTTGR